MTILMVPLEPVHGRIREEVVVGGRVQEPSSLGRAIRAGTWERGTGSAEGCEPRPRRRTEVAGIPRDTGRSPRRGRRRQPVRSGQATSTTVRAYFAVSLVIYMFLSALVYLGALHG